jgi:gentisate 1,2-dioxygenase
MNRMSAYLRRMPPPAAPMDGHPDDWPDGRPDGELHRMLEAVADRNLQPLWTQTRTLLTATPQGRAVPWAWRWADLLPLAREAGRLVPIERGGERRVLALANPGLGGRPYATQTLWAAVQYLGGHERAPSHRHSPAAVRFVLEGEGVWTLVDGDACAMAPGDLVLTPSWNWHEHHNPHDTPMLWFDGLDLPLVESLDAVFFEDTGIETAEQVAHRPIPPRSDSELIFGHAGLRPAGVPAPERHSPLLAYRWEHTDRALRALQGRSPGAAAVTVDYVDPVTGRDALPTMRCSMTRLRAGMRTATTRTAGSSVIVCFRGEGASVIDGTRIHWATGDMLAVPSWAALDHDAETAADLFVISDAPVLEALRLARTCTEGRQDVTAEFDAGTESGAEAPTAVVGGG